MVDINCKTYKCVAGHNSFIFPSTKTKAYLPSLQRDFFPKKKEAESDSAYDSEDELLSDGSEEDEQEEEVIPPNSQLLEQQLHSEFSPEAGSSSNHVSTHHIVTRIHVADDAALDIISCLKAEIEVLKPELQFEKDNNKKKLGMPGTMK
eukprot:scaffold65565_cov35-Attheya_sp.AAC.1